MCPVKLQTIILPLWATIGLVQATAIVGTVVEDHSGIPLGSVEVSVRQVGSSELIVDTETDTDGHFELPDLPAEKYLIDISKANYVATRIQATPANLNRLVARLVRCGVITGHVVDSENRVVRSATAFAMSRTSERGPLRPFARLDPGHEARVNEDGEYRLFNLPPGQYVVAVTFGAATGITGSIGNAMAEKAGSGVSYYPARSEPRLFTITGGEQYQDVDFSIAPSAPFSVSGKIDLDASQSGFWLALTSDNPSTFATAMTRAGEDGSFRFQDIPAGAYSLLVSGPSYSRGSLGMLVDENSLFGRIPVEVETNVDDLRVSVRKGRVASFILRSAFPGQPCGSSMGIQISPLEDWGANLNRMTTVGFDKPQRLDHLAPSRYLLTGLDSEANCYITSDSILDLTGADDDSPKVVLVASKGSIDGRVVSDGRALRWTVMLFPVFAASADAPLEVVFTDAATRFAFEGIRPGSYRVVARPANDLNQRWIANLSSTQPIEVKPGVATRVDLQPATDRSKE